MAGRIIVRDDIALDGNGSPYAAAKMYTFRTGTTSLLTTYTTDGMTVAHTNPVVANSAGRFADVWAPFDTAYRVVVTTGVEANFAGAVVLNDTDPIYALGAASNPAPETIASGGTIESGDVNKRLEITGPFTMPLGADLPAGWNVRLKCTVSSAAITYSGTDTGDQSTLYNTDFYDVTWNGTSFKFDYIGGGQGKYMVPIVATAMRPQTTNGAELAIAEMTTNKQMVASFNFDASTQEYGQFSFPMPKSWNESTITYRARWSHGATTVNFNVNWSLQAVAVSDGDALDAAWGTAVVVSDTGGTTNAVYVTAESAAVTIAGTPQEGDTVYFRVSRPVSGVTGNLAVDAKLSAIDLFITANAPNDQ